MTDPQPVIVQGLGSIGRKILRAAHADPGFAVVGAVDVAKTLVSRELPEVVDGAPAGLFVRSALGQARADAGAPSARSARAQHERTPAAATQGAAEAIVLHATGSYLDDVAPQLEEALRLGLHVVSTCEELAYPFDRHPAIARRLDDLARRAGLTLVGTGVNPGFLMDQLVVTLTAASHDIRAVRVARVIDPRPRRLQFQKKIGLNIDRAEFDRLRAGGRFGHVGLRESACLVARGLGWEIAEWRETIEPVQRDTGSPVLGMIHTLSGAAADGRTIDLRFEVHADVAHGYDAIEIDGTPPLRLRFDGGVFGDDATAAAVLRAARALPSAPRGLITVLDLPLRARKPDQPL